jgi:hypothetical protein
MLERCTTIIKAEATRNDSNLLEPGHGAASPYLANRTIGAGADWFFFPVPESGDSKLYPLKGTVSRDFRPSVFFVNRSPLGP